jgi:hypothetical protein
MIKKKIWLEIMTMANLTTGTLAGVHWKNAKYNTYLSSKKNKILTGIAFPLVAGRLLLRFPIRQAHLPAMTGAKHSTAEWSVPSFAATKTVALTTPTVGAGSVAVGA